jgi:plastocyanin
MTALPAAAAEAQSTDAPEVAASWDYRTIFVVWDQDAFDWRAEWNDGSATVGLEAVLDSEGSAGWELDSIAHERFDLVVGAEGSSQEARRLRLIFRRPLGGSAAAATHVAPSSAPVGSLVTIAGFAFAPALIEVPAGGTVTWTNDDDVPHTATAGDGAFDSGTLPPGASYGHIFAAPGTYPYACLIHPGMTGTVVAT